MSVKNIISVYNLATVTDRIIGQGWYGRALAFARSLAADYHIDAATIVGVIASLSPRNKWERNMIDAETMVKASAAGGTFNDLMSLKACTFSRNKEKAATILSQNITDRDQLLATLKGPKLQEFFNCILGDSEDVCIDGHAYSVWVGDRVTLANVPSIGIKLRRTIKADYIQAAKILGVAPHVVQAITWVTWKRLHEV